LANSKTVIVAGASQGIGAAIVQSFLDHGYQVVATSRGATKARFGPSPNLVLVDGDSLASEYAKENIRFNSVAPGVVDTPFHTVDIADAVFYLMETRHVTGKVLHVDGGAHIGRW